MGFLYHMFNSVIIGAMFVFGAFIRGYGHGAVLGPVYGTAWWVLGPMILTPLLSGMGGPQFGMALSPPMLMSLVGHLAYGLLTGWYTWCTRGRVRREARGIEVYSPTRGIIAYEIGYIKTRQC